VVALLLPLLPVLVAVAEAGLQHGVVVVLLLQLLVQVDRAAG
jgi:hypothetical protein